LLQALKEGGWEVEIRQYLPDQELRQVYEDALLVVVPVIPSSQPAGLTATCEALAMGCAVVVTSHWMTDEYINPGRTALRTPPRDPQGLAEALARVVTDPALMADLRAGAQASRDALSFGRSLEVFREAMLRFR
jgi:glycosyltransferase involved in cell wall biosynthesis